MGDRTGPVLRHIASFGTTAQPGDTLPGPVAPGMTLNSPVGVALDRAGNVWVCDTGNNRLLVFDADLSTLRHVLHAPESAVGGEAALPFHMPFHVCPHPEKNRVFVSDMGNSRIVVLDLTEGAPRFAGALGNTAQKGFAPLQDPNGLTLVRGKKGFELFVNDEFFHNATDPLRNRCVRLTEDGRYLGEFRSVQVKGRRHDLTWPQGLASDAKGHLYLANTGNYEILRCAADAPVDGDYVASGGSTLIAHRFGTPRGLGMLNIMRDVNVVGDRVFVPDHVANTISVYHTDGRPLATVAGLRAGWHHGPEPVNSPSDPLYYFLEDTTLVSPYVICDGGAPDVFFISEPFTSRILKVRIDFSHGPRATAKLIAAVGKRRDDPASASNEQLNCVTSVIAFAQPESSPGAAASPAAAWPVSASAALAGQYDVWWGHLTRATLQHSGGADWLREARLVLDAGNWRLTACRAQGAGYVPDPVQLDAWFLAGNLGLASFVPDFPLLGQWVPGTPIVLAGNFDTGTISLYQIGPLGNLVNFGLPFGVKGKGPACLSGPQGMAASGDGHVYIADTLNNRMAHWQILPSGTARPIRTFVWEGEVRGDSPFTPTDAALAADGRLYVTDQFNDRICVFDRDGRSLFSFGRQGYWEEGNPDGERFMLPTSLAIEGERLYVNDLVNRALKVFALGADTPRFIGGLSLFKLSTAEGGVWMPFLMHAREGRVYLADSTYNIVQVYACD